MKTTGSRVRAEAPRAGLKGKSKKVTRGNTSVERMEEEKPKKMMGGGKTVLAEDGMNKISGYAKGKKVMAYRKGGVTMSSRGCGAARKQKFGKNG
tara:strand:+ start:2677 stop:2961 length:285 start_codon:yes stop_codon:yes gene_type:complete